MASHLERFSKIRPLRAIVAAGGLALLLTLGLAGPAAAQDYPTPPPNPPTSVPHRELPRTGSDNTEKLALVGGAVLLTGAGLVVVSKRRRDAHTSA